MKKAAKLFCYFQKSSVCLYICSAPLLSKVVYFLRINTAAAVAAASKLLNKRGNLEFWERRSFSRIASPHKTQKFQIPTVNSFPKIKEQCGVKLKFFKDKQKEK